MVNIDGMKPHELARGIVERLQMNPQPQSEMDDMMEELLCLVDEDEARRLLKQAEGPRTH